MTLNEHGSTAKCKTLKRSGKRPVKKVEGAREYICIKKNILEVVAPTDDGEQRPEEEQDDDKLEEELQDRDALLQIITTYEKLKMNPPENIVAKLARHDKHSAVEERTVEQEMSRLKERSRK